VASAHGQAEHGRAIENGTPLRPLPPRAVGRSLPAGEIARYVGAVSILLVGIVHAQQYYSAYFSVVPTIGTLFLLSFIGSGVVGAVLLAPVRRLGRNLGDLILVLAALGAIGIALGSLASLLVSEYMPLFGFMESGYRLAIVLALVFDALTTVSLAVFVLIVARQRRDDMHLTARPTISNERNV
jgi:hypothetical protein